MKKLLLASAIAAAATSATALEAMSDSAMSETTGQDGLTILMNVNASADLVYIDRDGIGGTSTAGGLSMTNTITGDVRIDVDVATDAAGNNALVLGVSADTLEIGVGDIYVGAVADGEWDVTDVNGAPILDAMDVSISNLTADIALKDDATFDLGTGGATSLADLSLTIDTVTITGIQISDSDGYQGAATTHAGAGVTGTQGSLGIAQVDITGVTLDSQIDIDGGAGLVIELSTLTLDAKITDIDINGTSIGDVALNNMVLDGTAITISGH